MSSRDIWNQGYGVITHRAETAQELDSLIPELIKNSQFANPEQVYSLFRAADLIANAGLWLVAHMTYANRVYLDGRVLKSEDFKPVPEGHTGGSLNVVIAYVGYLLANALKGETSSWIMGQGHCVSAIDAINILVDNVYSEYHERYSVSDSGLTNLVQDFYLNKVDGDGRPISKVGSHVGPLTAGGIIEGGYLGFAELYYVHMPLPGEELVAILSDGAFEEQRGSDWVSRWWRAEDCGKVIPVLIANGRRIDQRTALLQEGGPKWFSEVLRLHSFAPRVVDGRDPAAIACAIIRAGVDLENIATEVRKGKCNYPIPMPYVIAETTKGFGFPGAGTNRAHNLPLIGNPSVNAEAVNEFNLGAARVYVPECELRAAIKQLQNHKLTGRVKEAEHVLAHRNPEISCPEPAWAPTPDERSPMESVDSYFCSLVASNPHLRPRVGNPDELSSNRMTQTLQQLKHRVTSPEVGVEESIDGKIITALNEEAVVCAALANKGGINLAVSYEAFATKMLGALRQEIIFSRHQKEVNRSPNWLSVPIVVSSHLWENGKNEQSHQDPSLSESLMQEMSDVSRVIYVADFNSAAAALRACYESRGQIWTLVVPKRSLPNYFTAEQSRELVSSAAICVSGSTESDCLLVASGAYQLQEAMKATRVLTKAGIAIRLIYLLEPGRFRIPRDKYERHILVPQEKVSSLFPENIQQRVFIGHGHPENLMATLRSLDTGPKNSLGLGYINRGGTLDVFGMLYANRCTWAHIVQSVSSLVGAELFDLLSREQVEALRGEGNPYSLVE